MKMVRCIRVQDNGILLQNVDGTIFFEEDTGIEDWLKYKQYMLVNAKYNPFSCRYETVCGKRTIQRYTHFHWGESLDNKSYTKSTLLGVAYDDTQNKLWDYCVITDFNNKVSKNIKANSVMFDGIKPLKTREIKERITIRADEITIKNICVYGNIIPDPLSDYEMLAKDFCIKHNFIDTNTVDEIYHIFKEVYGLAVSDNKFLNSSVVQRPEHFRSIVPKFNTELASFDEVYNRVQHIIQEESSKDSRIEVLKVAFLLSMYIGTNKYYKLKDMLDSQIERADNIKYDVDTTNMFLRLADLQRLYREVTK